MVCSILSVLLAVIVVALWRTPITAYIPKTEDEKAITAVFIDYITARNDRDVDRFLSTLHPRSKYMVTKDRIVSKGELRGMLPGLWMQNDDDQMAFGHCMAWECWNENFYRTGMLINPKFQIDDDRATVTCKFNSGLFLDENYFRLIRENGAWLITSFLRPMN